MINSLQLIFHLPIMSIIAPANIITMFQILIPVVMFDVMESMDFFGDMFPNSEEDMMESNESVLDQMRNIGYDSYNPILNLGTLFILIAIYAASIILWAIIIVPMRKLNLLGIETSRKIKKSLFWK